MPRNQITNRIIEEGAIAVVRLQDPGKALKVAEAICAGGISIVEITMTVPNALEVIADIDNNLGSDILLGVGSVTDDEMARKAINAGAQFVVSPIYKKSIVQMAHRHNVPALPGAFTPNEIYTAHEEGADIVKVFPADVVGMAFFKAIKAPLPYLKIMPTGGVSLTNAGDWLRAGACAVGVGGALIDKKAIDNNDFDKLTQNARTLSQSIAEARE